MKRQKLRAPYTLEKRRLWGKPFVGTPKPHRIYTGVVSAVDDESGLIEVRVGDGIGAISLKNEERFNPKRLKPSEFTKVGAALRVGVRGAATDGKFPLALELGPQSAMVVIDVRTRELRAIVGSYEALSGGLDRATQSRRQPGSSFKPFVYGYALHARRFSPATVLELPPAKPGGEKRRLSLRRAIAKSDNAAAQKIFREAGPVNIVKWAAACGIQSPLKPDLSLALGAYEVTPLEIANAYATIASGGNFASTVLVTKIIGPDGKERPLPPRPPARRVMDVDEAYLTTSLLRTVVREGTAKRALAVGRPVAGKTGTTNRAKDAWFVGFSTEFVVSTWVGYDDAAPLGWGEQGAVTALPA